MRKIVLTGVFSLVSAASLFAQVAPEADSHSRTKDKAWIDVSNGYVKELLDIGLQHGPEGGSAQGLSQFDTLTSKGTLADDKIQRRETEAALAKIAAAMKTEKDKNVLEDTLLATGQTVGSSLPRDKMRSRYRQESKSIQKRRLNFHRSWSICPQLRPRSLGTKE